MNPRELQVWKEGILAEVRKMIDAKFQPGNDDLSKDSTIALQQINTALQALKAETTKINEVVKEIATVQTSHEEALRKLKDEANVTKVALGAEVKALSSWVDRISMKQEISTAAKDILTLQETTSSIIIKQRDLESTLSTLKSQQSGLRAKVNLADTDSSAKNSSVTEVESLKKSITAIEFKVNDLNHRLAVGLVYDDTVLLNKVGQLETDFQHTVSKVTLCADGFQEIGKRLMVTQKTLEESKAEILALTSIVSTHQPFDPVPLQSKIASLESKLSTQGSATTPAVGQPIADLDLIKHRLEDVETRTRVLAETEVNLKGQMNNLISLAAARSEVDKLLEKIQNLEKSVAQLTPPASTPVFVAPPPHAAAPPGPVLLGGIGNLFTAQ